MSSCSHSFRKSDKIYRCTVAYLSSSLEAFRFLVAVSQYPKSNSNDTAQLST